MPLPEHHTHVPASCALLQVLLLAGKTQGSKPSKVTASQVSPLDLISCITWYLPSGQEVRLGILIGPVDACW